MCIVFSETVIHAKSNMATDISSPRLRPRLQLIESTDHVQPFWKTSWKLHPKRSTPSVRNRNDTTNFSQFELWKVILTLWRETQNARVRSAWSELAPKKNGVPTCFVEHCSFYFACILDLDATHKVCMIGRLAMFVRWTPSVRIVREKWGNWEGVADNISTCSIVTWDISTCSVVFVWYFDFFFFWLVKSPLVSLSSRYV